MYFLRIQHNIFRYIAVAVAIFAFITVSFLFVRWLYWNNSSSASLEVFDYTQELNNIERYSDSLYINIINNTIPTAKICYENKYGEKLPSFATTISDKLFGGMNFDIKNPKTYFSFVFMAFSQYDPSNTQVAWNNDDKELPNITNFEEAPEGAIYFSEEDEYMSEENVNKSIDASSADNSDTTDDYENLGDPARLEIEKKEASILLLHTHSMESYSPFNANNYHSLNDKENVVLVGNIMTNVLESKYKYNVIHDKTRHDKVSYGDSYINSLNTIKSQVSKNKSIEVVLDVHRDAFKIKNEIDAKNKKAEYTVEVNGKNAARIMLVIGNKNPNYAELKKFAVYVQKKMDKLYPGLFFKVVTKNGKYNQYFKDHSMLIEVGCTQNTDAEAKYSAELMGNVLGEVLKELEQ